MRWLSLIGLCLYAVVSAAFADAPGERVRSLKDNPSMQAVVSQLAAADRLRSRFRQLKTLQLLSRPLVSEGVMVFDRGVGLSWQTLSPVATTLIVTDKKIAQIGDLQQQTITAASNPVAFGFAQTFFQVLTGDVQTLENEFEMYFSRDGELWTIALVPKDAQMRDVFKEIMLSGAADLERVIMTDHAGDTTTIEFLDRQSNGAELTDQERARFVF